MNFVSSGASGIGDTCCGLDISSYAWFWGCNKWGQFGNNNTAQNISIPVSVIGGRQWIKVVTDSTSSCGINLSSYVWSWGFNNYGQLGNNNTTSVSSPISVIGGMQVLDMQVGTSFVVTLDRSSYAWGWGWNYWGIAGNSPNNLSSPASVLGGRQFTAIRANSAAVIASDASSYLWCWGYSVYNSQSYSSPFSIGKQGLLKNVNITADAQMLAYLDYSSYAWAWSVNDYYLGVGTAVGTFILTPASVIGGRQFTSLEANINGLLGFTNNSNAYFATGSNATMLTNLNGNYFICGVVNNSSPIAISPLKIPYVGSPVSIAGGRQFTNIKNVCGNGGNYLAVDGSSYLWTWGGNNTYGSLGNNTITINSSPISVVGGRQFILKNVYINTDNPNACVALDASSYAWTWGFKHIRSTWGWY